MQESSHWAVHLPAGAGKDLDLLAGESLPRVWAGHFEHQAERAALADFAAGDLSDWLTYGELEARSRSIASRLHGAGAVAGDRVLFSASASSALAVAYVACLRLGLVVVPANTAYTQREIEHIAQDAAPTVAIVDDRDRASWIGDVTTIRCGPDVDLPEGAEPPLDRAGRDDLALIAYTSGTTGAPKGAMLSHGNLLSSVEALRLAWRWTRDDRLILSLPLFHLHGLGVGLHGTLATGASAVVLPKFEEVAVLDAAAASSATLFFGVPTMYARLAASERVGELSRLRLCVSGSAPLPADLHRTLSSRAGQRVLERYGMTETVMNISNPYDGERRPGSVGLPLPGVEVRLSADGEILLRGPNVFSGYWRRPDATKEAFDENGWFSTGDLGELASDGYVTIKGRSKELIITGGYNVYPREVEDVLSSHPLVKEVAVAGLPSTEWGQTVAAWIVPRDDLSLEDLDTFVAERLANFKRPRMIRLVDELPRNAMGKVVKSQLLDC
jgi:malonyl-CoA/methylmalonyl-CoA synthetase